MRILVVDDEPAVRDAVDRALRLEGYDTQLAADGREALDALADRAPDALVLDVLMPHVDGLEVCRRLRAAGDRTPVLVLTARDAVPDRVRGLDAGADDYLVKPFALEELLARLRALLRRTASADTDELLRYADVELDPNGHTVRRGRRPVELTRTEFLLLELFLRHPRQVLTRSQIFERVWGYDFGPGVELARGVRGIPAPQAGGGRRAAAAADGARRRLRPARAVSFRRRIAVTAASAVAVAVVLGSIVAYVVVRDVLRDQIDASLRSALPVVGARFTMPAAARAPSRRSSRSSGPVRVRAARLGRRGTVVAPQGRTRAARRSRRGPGGRRRPARAVLHRRRRSTAPTCASSPGRPRTARRCRSRGR